MITLNLNWHEVLWWMQGGMAGSHLRWSVYEDMVNKVWPQCSEQERRNMWFIMRRDLGSWWRVYEYVGPLLLRHVGRRTEPHYVPQSATGLRITYRPRLWPWHMEKQSVGGSLSVPLATRKRFSKVIDNSNNPIKNIYDDKK